MCHCVSFEVMSRILSGIYDEFLTLQEKGDKSPERLQALDKDMLLAMGSALAVNGWTVGEYQVENDRWYEVNLRTTGPVVTTSEITHDKGIEPEE